MKIMQIEGGLLLKFTRGEKVDDDSMRYRRLLANAEADI